MKPWTALVGFAALVGMMAVAACIKLAFDDEAQAQTQAAQPVNRELSEHEVEVLRSVKTVRFGGNEVMVMRLRHELCRWGKNAYGPPSFLYTGHFHKAHCYDRPYDPKDFADLARQAAKFEAESHATRDDELEITWANISAVEDPKRCYTVGGAALPSCNYAIHKFVTVNTAVQIRHVTLGVIFRDSFGAESGPEIRGVSSSWDIATDNALAKVTSSPTLLKILNYIQ
jgi:hypothetical protein